MLALPSFAVSEPLHERTNTHTESISLGHCPMQSPPAAKAVRRTDSLRRIRFKSESDSLPEEDSIYNADPVSSGETTPAQEKIRWQLPPSLISPPTSNASVEHVEEEPDPHLSPPLRSRSPPLGHSNWPVPMLDTILERKSARSLRGSLSAPRLGASPERSPKVVKTRASIRSIHPTVTSSTSPWPRELPLPSTGLHQARSFSMNDLQCTKSICKRISETCSPASSRSSEALRRIATRPTSPLQPAGPPPYRYPTPPGLPSFRTREAQQLRLQERQDSRGLRIVQRWFRHEEDSNDERPFSQHGSETRVSPPAEDQNANQPLEMLKRIFGMSRIVQTPSQNPYDRPRVSLPPGLYSTGTPGILAVANDGTQIRGKFGNRQSSHGIGGRTLHSHPFGIPQGQAAIEEAVHQIDKACSETSNGPDRNHLLQLPQFPSIAEELTRHSTVSEFDRSLRIGARAPSPSSARPSTRSPPVPPANTGANTPLRSPFRSPNLTARTMDSTSAMGMNPASPASSVRYRMSEPRAYPPSSPARSRGLRTSRGGMHSRVSFVEEGENASGGQRCDESIRPSQRERSDDDANCCARGWHSSCLQRCC